MDKEDHGLNDEQNQIYAEMLRPDENLSSETAGLFDDSVGLVRADSRSYRIAGTCPRCGHPMTKSGSLDVVLPSVPGNVKVHPQEGSLPVTIRCSCQHEHKEAPTAVKGCGAVFTVIIPKNRVKRPDEPEAPDGDLELPPLVLSDKEEADLNALQDKANQQLFKSLTDWRNGFAAVLVIASGGLTISALNTISRSNQLSRWVLAACVIIGTILGICALIVALRAEVGTKRDVKTSSDIIHFGGTRALETQLADAAAKKLRKSQYAGAASLVIFAIGLGTLWWASAEANGPKLQVEYRTNATIATTTVCGELKSADGHTVRLKVSGYNDPVAIAFEEITNMRVVEKC